LREHYAPGSEEGIMECYFKMFDDIFFCGSLKGLCKIKFCQDSGVDYWGITYSSEADRTGREEIPDGYAAFIEIVDILALPPSMAREEFSSKDDHSRLKCYPGTLLHEMLHVFFGTYVCRCCEGRCALFNEEIGEMGHQNSWQLATLAIEDVALPLLGENSIWLAIPASNMTGNMYGQSTRQHWRNLNFQYEWRLCSSHEKERGRMGR
jgi:hypothetical protein